MITKTMTYTTENTRLLLHDDNTWTTENGQILLITIADTHGEITIPIPFETLKIIINEFEVD